MSLASTSPMSERRTGTEFALRVLLVVESRCATAARQPITVGLPFSRGLLTDGAHLTLHGPEGAVGALQAETLARWSDGSVKWLLLDGMLPPLTAGVSEWALSVAEGANGKQFSPLRIEESAWAVTIDTDAARFQLDCRTAVLRVHLAGKELLDSRGASLRLTDAGGREAETRVEQWEIETRGPVRATVRLQGAFDGIASCRFVIRFDFFAGTGLVRVRLTLHNPNRAEHPGGLWDLGDRNSLLFRDLSVELPLKGPVRTTWKAEADQDAESAEGVALEIYQDSSGGENWQSPNHVNRDDRVPCSFRGYRLKAGGQERTGLRALPVVSVQGADGCVTCAIPEFWQQFPKVIEVQGSTLRLSLFPAECGDLFELQGGEQKTHTFWLHFGADGDSPMSSLDWVHDPANVHADPAWYAEAGAIPHLAPADIETGARLDGYLAEVVAGPHSFFAKRERIDEYGWRHFGEVYADHEEAYCPKPPPIISHYNNQFDVVHGLLLQYLRTGDVRWRALADPLARHVADIDIYHTTQDKAAYNGGLFWFTDHYYDAGTCTHRTYSRTNCKPGDHSYGGGPDSQHNFATGLLHYYYLTGDPTAAEAVRSLADWVLGMDDGRRVKLLGLIDDGPTGLASRTADAAYHGPGRGCGNSISVLLDGYLLTQERVYLDKAEELIRRSIHPNDDVAALDLLNAEKRWSYTVYLSALARYLDVKAELGAFDFTYAYARASLLRYAAWMAEDERPYFDQPEQLEYPTEAWGAQEMRKANVMRLAAAHADEPLRTRLLRRGQELADRAWHDVLRFDTRHVARAVAVVMIEGTRDLYFRLHEPKPAPRPKEEHDFGKPKTFVPQKARVKARLKTPGGLVCILGKLANPLNWRSLV